MAQHLEVFGFRGFEARRAVRVVERLRPENVAPDLLAEAMHAALFVGEGARGERDIGTVLAFGGAVQQVRGVVFFVGDLDETTSVGQGGVVVGLVVLVFCIGGGALRERGG